MLPKAILTSKKGTSIHWLLRWFLKTLLLKKYLSKSKPHFFQKGCFTPNHHYVRNKNFIIQVTIRGAIPTLLQHPKILTAKMALTKPSFFKTPKTSATNTHLFPTQKRIEASYFTITSIRKFQCYEVIKKSWWINFHKFVPLQNKIKSGLHRVVPQDSSHHPISLGSQPPPAKGCFLPGWVMIQMVGCS